MMLYDHYKSITGAMKTADLLQTFGEERFSTESILPFNTAINLR
jgi:hypothetical protein